MNCNSTTYLYRLANAKLPNHLCSETMTYPNCRGMSPASAELMYIKLAQQLQEYGHEAFQMLDIHGSTIWIGACFIGIMVKHSNGQPNIYFK